MTLCQTQMPPTDLSFVPFNLMDNISEYMFLEVPKVFSDGWSSAKVTFNAVKRMKQNDIVKAFCLKSENLWLF